MKKFILLILLLNFIFNIYADNTADTTKKSYNGWDYYSMGKYNQSLQALENEKKVTPEQVNIYIIMAWDYRELKDFVKMELISLDGLKLQPTDARVLKNLAEAYYFQKRYYEAIPVFEKFIKYKFSWSDPYIQYAYYYLGACYYYTKQYWKADMALSTSNYYAGKVYNTLILLADVKQILGHNKKAFTYYTLANQVQPNTQRAIDGINNLKDKQN